ncbi:hypothetical protein B0T16DRAFT_418537 [Cercophora newfieldiana]|uniref:RBR-type E3 ubiquitin transferase n=1 Tax=Cercophora newfieldiana TaxID=92897 RepID=A0AA39XV52_9PEZI|nr:hypothetical protein B0T16DRAFT_418537 [Cercophora newfieldiana]
MAMEEYDMLVVIDQTASMATYLRSLTRSLQDVIRISSLTGCFSRIGIMAYGDYCGGPITNWSGWYSLAGDSAITQQWLVDFSTNLRADHGGDWPEATKTGLAHAYHVMRADAKTLILLYTDAPPHMPSTGGENHDAEMKSLATSGKYGQTGPLFTDWVTGARALAAGEKRAQVFAFIEEQSGYSAQHTLLPYTFLSEVTGGACLQVKRNTGSKAISELTVSLLLAWMGVEKEGAQRSSQKIAELLRYKDTASIGQVVSEESRDVVQFMLNPRTKQDHAEAEKQKKNMLSDDLSLKNMADLIPQREPKLADFSKRYSADPDYQKLVTNQMAELIREDVTAITLNPVFGSLWRAVCNDRLNPKRDTLIADFGLRISEASENDKGTLKTWLEASYDRVGEILQIIDSVPAAEQYPCVFIDPTLRFSQEKEAKLTRDELLEISRSCDPRILARLGKVLTRLVYVEGENKLPLHLKDVSLKRVARIPLALADKKNGRQFWKVLLHCVVPGTMLAGRPAALLAALSVRMGISRLEDVAYQELLGWKNQWRSLDIPETWNASCLGLLLEADEKLRTKKSAEGGTAREVLSGSDRQLFKTLVEYKLLELNMQTTLTAKISWDPDRARMPIGPVVVCKQCQYPRSVTMMSKDGICGMCVPSTYAHLDDKDKDTVRQQLTHGHVSKDDGDTTPATWVECAVTHCRAQYIVYFVEHLNVRPKCHYCRFTKEAAPFVECTTCLSRMIWPEEYRPDGFDKATFKCVGCSEGKTTIIEEETSAEKLVQENRSSDWLLRNTGNKIAQPFSGRSLFYVISKAGLEMFTEAVEVLPQIKEAPELRIRGKLVRNPQELTDYLRSWITSRKVEEGTCSLCFGDFKKRELRRACGRSGCKQEICGDCMRNWYGLNSRGRVINAAALCCPFCRRQPSPKADIPRDLRFLGGLREAVAESQAGWIYAWCASCGLAKRYMERVCAANGEPVELTNWCCEECPKGRGIKTFIKECPGCQTPTEKMGGCDHITCPVCAAHWCFYCGKQAEFDNIYKHMSEEHGGFYDGGDYDGYYEGEGYDSDYGEE